MNVLFGFLLLSTIAFWIGYENVTPGKPEKSPLKTDELSSLLKTLGEKVKAVPDGLKPIADVEGIREIADNLLYLIVGGLVMFVIIMVVMRKPTEAVSSRHQSFDYIILGGCTSQLTSSRTNVIYGRAGGNGRSQKRQALILALDNDVARVLGPTGKVLQKTLRQLNYDAKFVAIDDVKKVVEELHAFVDNVTHADAFIVAILAHGDRLSIFDKALQGLRRSEILDIVSKTTGGASKDVTRILLWEGCRGEEIYSGNPNEVIKEPHYDPRIVENGTNVKSIQFYTTSFGFVACADENGLSWGIGCFVSTLKKMRKMSTKKQISVVETLKATRVRIMRENDCMQGPAEIEMSTESSISFFY